MPDAALHVGSGKVRELYALDDDRLLLVASDRISTFDVVLPTEIPDKGRVLCGLSAFWFARTRGICPNHLLSVGDDGRSMECRRLEMLPIECVVRGYLAGSGWKDYLRTGEVCGHRLPRGLSESDRLPEPILTPATKAVEGHDENIDLEAAAELVGPKVLAQLRTFTNYTGDGLVASVNPAQKKQPGCYHIIEVKGGKWVKTFPSSGFHCV